LIFEFEIEIAMGVMCMHGTFFYLIFLYLTLDSFVKVCIIRFIALND
jgi:hypothetical protein